ncbi:MAG: hypothetical protein C4589_06360 [Peptococcaceae bacterium]|nr:MAG: hypothetical protein C4589_06360 [Peptococcaceae bacterium]
MTTKWARLLNAGNEMEADMICGLLEGEGIPTAKKYKGPNIIIGPSVGLEIWAPENRLEEAAVIIKAFSGS